MLREKKVALKVRFALFSLLLSKYEKERVVGRDGS